MAVSLSGQATTSQDTGEASSTIILGDYPEAMGRASQLLFEDAMGPTDDLLSEGHMTKMDIQSADGINQSLHCTVGHFGEEGVNQLFGRKSLPVTSANSKLAKLILQGAHQGVLQFNHQKSQDALARSQGVAFIYHGEDLAKKIRQECVLCTLREAKRCEQLIGKISPTRLSPSPPFTSVTADVAGPYIIQDSTSSTRISKVWALIYHCAVKHSTPRSWRTTLGQH